MAYDDCTDRIYVTDGRAVLRATFVLPWHAATSESSYHGFSLGLSGHRCPSTLSSTL
jgi:hypothetical protein